MIDTTTRQPCNLMDIRDGELMNWVEKDKVNPMSRLSRVKMSEEAECVRTIDTGYNDVDINGHINSVKYIEHVLDLWSIDWYREHRLRRFDIAYVAECHQGDRLTFYRAYEFVEMVTWKWCAVRLNSYKNVRIFGHVATNCYLCSRFLRTIVIDDRGTWCRIRIHFHFITYHSGT